MRGQGLWRGAGRLSSTGSRGRGHWASRAACSGSSPHSSRCHHHMGVRKPRPLVLPLLCRWAGQLAPATQGATGRAGASRTLHPRWVQCLVTNCARWSTCLYPVQTFWAWDDHQQSMTGLSPFLPVRRLQGTLQGLRGWEALLGWPRSFPLCPGMSPCDRGGVGRTGFALLLWSCLLVPQQWHP